MEITHLFPGSFASNCYVLTSGNRSAVVDPSADVREIKNALSGTRLDFILLTHGHFDHLLGLEALLAVYPVPVLIHEKDFLMPENARKNAYFTFFQREKSFPSPTGTFSDGERISLGEETVRVLHTPGHTEGSSCFLVGNVLLTGDTLFANGYGRCDLYGGDEEELFRSLQKLRSLSSILEIYPGHGESAKLEFALDNCFY